MESCAGTGCFGVVEVAVEILASRQSFCSGKGLLYLLLALWPSGNPLTSLNFSFIMYLFSTLSSAGVCL